MQMMQIKKPMANLQQIADIVGIALIRSGQSTFQDSSKNFLACQVHPSSFKCMSLIFCFVYPAPTILRCQSPRQAVAARPSPGTSRGRPARKLQVGTVPAVLLGTAVHTSAARKREEGRRARQATEANGGRVREGDGGRKQTQQFG